VKKTTNKIIILFLTTVVIIIGATIAVFLVPPKYDPISFPDGKKFAFSICDDTDNASEENILPIYNYLYQIGLRTTKTVWVLPSNDTLKFANRGESLADSSYTAFILDLQSKGFEIAIHGARGGNTKRMETRNSLEKYKGILGEYPNIHINHFKNEDNLYWGKHKLSLVLMRILYEWVAGEEEYTGHDPESEYFWGDMAQEYITYVVNYSFHEINVLKVNPKMPYHDPKRPYVNYWFHTSDGGAVDAFNQLLRKENLDQLEREGGVCIVYTHLARGFCADGVVNETTKERLQDLASRNGWFVPVSEILDYLRDNRKDKETLSFRERIYLELHWVLEKIRHGSS